MDLELNSNSLHNVGKLHQNVNQFLFCFVRYLKPRSNQLLELSDPRFLEDRADPRIGIEQINRSVPFKVSHLLLVELVVLYPRLPQIVVLNRPDSDFLRGVLELLLFEISDLSLPLFLRPLHKSPQRFLLRFVQQHISCIFRRRISRRTCMLATCGRPLSGRAFAVSSSTIWGIGGPSSGC